VGIPTLLMGDQREVGVEEVEGRAVPRDRRKEENWRKRQRKNRSRAVAKRKRIEAEEGRERAGSRQEQVVKLDEEERIEEDNEEEVGTVCPPPSSELSSHITYANDGMTMTSMTRITGDDDDAVPPIEEGDKYDYGVVKGKTKSSVFVHGNYDRYYGYRVPGKGGGRVGAEGSETQDPRLELLEKGWFHKKRCLDVGCNEGILTLNLVKKFRTATMTAIDLDEHLVKRACVNLRKASSTAVAEHAKCQGKQRGPEGSHAEQPQGDQGQNEGWRRKEAKQRMVSLSKTWFVHGNVLASKVERGSFDCITALSVSKWIHLHSGDGGIRAFFGKVRDMLAPGGKFILEPQGWRSYKSAVAKVKRSSGGQLPNKSYFGRLDELKLRPEDFSDLLSSEYGLRLIRRLDGTGPGRASHGFGDRHLLVFVKT
jgi:7SK snRNA methylphosphate capping enzyme